MRAVEIKNNHLTKKYLLKCNNYELLFRLLYVLL